MFDQEYLENRSYITYNNLAIFGHFLSAVCMIILIAQNGSISIPYTETYQGWKNIILMMSAVRCRSFNTSSSKFYSDSTSPVQ